VCYRHCPHLWLCSLDPLGGCYAEGSDHMPPATVPAVAVRVSEGAVSAVAVAGASEAGSRVVLDRPSYMWAEGCCMLSCKTHNTTVTTVHNDCGGGRGKTKCGNMAEWNRKHRAREHDSTHTIGAPLHTTKDFRYATGFLPLSSQKVVLLSPLYRHYIPSRVREVKLSMCLKGRRTMRAP
jgi:hypothetical protein